MRQSVLALVCGLLCLGGCSDDGPRLSKVTGVVKVDGSPKSKLLVTFTPDKGPGAMSTTNEKGEYYLNTGGRPGAVQGQHKISITTVFDAQPTSTTSTASAPSGGDAYMNQANIKPKDFKPPVEPLPAKYNKNSELMRQVEAGSNKFDFELETK